MSPKPSILKNGRVELTFAEMKKNVKEVGLGKENQERGISAKQFWRDSLAQDLMKMTCWGWLDVI